MKNKLIFVFIGLLYLVSFLLAFFLFRKAPASDFVLILPPFNDPLVEKINKMSLENKVGQLMFISHDWHELANLNDWQASAGGLLINGQFGQDDAELLKNSILDMKLKTATASAVLPFVGVDQEGGPVCRFPWLDCTGQRQISEASQASSLAEKRGLELTDLHLNVVMAPVLDIAENKNDFIYSRTFNGPVGELGAAMIKGFKKSKIISCAKHFPGHGGTNIDSHYQLPTIDCDESCLQERLDPFKKAIEAGVEMMMVGHVQLNLKTQMSNVKTRTQNSNLNKPASLSPLIITDILRNQLNFKGVIVTDDLNMGAIKNFQFSNFQFSINRNEPYWWISESAVRAIQAGADMVMVTGDASIQETVYQRLIKAVQNNEITQEQLRGSLKRTLQLKAANSLIN